MEERNMTAAQRQVNNRRRQPETIDLIELAFAYLEQWKIILLAMLVGASLFGAYHSFRVGKVYSADAKIFIGDTNSVISVTDLQIGSVLSDDYVTIIKSRTVMHRVIKEMGLDMSFQALQSMVSVEIPEGTHIIKIVVRCNDPELCRDIANTIMNVSIEIIGQTMTNGKPSIVDTAEAEAIQNITPSFKKYVAMGGILGAMFVCALITLKFLLDTTMKTEQDIEKYLELPILASIPYYDVKTGK